MSSGEVPLAKREASEDPLLPLRMQMAVSLSHAAGRTHCSRVGAG